MSLRVIEFYLGYALCWALLPVLAVAGIVALLAYAILTELGDFLIGHGEKAIDTSTAREIARRMCLGH